MEIVVIGAAMRMTGLFLGAFGHKVTIIYYEGEAP